jgi:hypothetical protein
MTEKLSGRATGGPYAGQLLTYRHGERIPISVREGDTVRRDCYYEWTGRGWKFVKPKRGAADGQATSA